MADLIKEKLKEFAQVILPETDPQVHLVPNQHVEGAARTYTLAFTNPEGQSSSDIALKAYKYLKSGDLSTEDSKASLGGKNNNYSLSQNIHVQSEDDRTYVTFSLPPQTDVLANLDKSIQNARNDQENAKEQKSTGATLG